MCSYNPGHSQPHTGSVVICARRTWQLKFIFTHWLISNLDSLLLCKHNVSFPILEFLSVPFSQPRLPSPTIYHSRSLRWLLEANTTGKAFTISRDIYSSFKALTEHQALWWLILCIKLAGDMEVNKIEETPEHICSKRVWDFSLGQYLSTSRIWNLEGDILRGTEIINSPLS